MTDNVNVVSTSGSVLGGYYIGDYRWPDGISYTWYPTVIHSGGWSCPGCKRCYSSALTICPYCPEPVDGEGWKERAEEYRKDRDRLQGEVDALRKLLHDLGEKARKA